MQMVRTSLLYCSYVFLVSPFTSFAQTTYLDLKPNPLNLGDTPFYLTRVVDARQYADCIGKVTIADNEQTVCLKFSKGLETTLYNHIAPSLPKNDSGKLAMVIKVVELFVTEQVVHNKKKWITGLELEIYHIKNGLETNLFKSSSKTEITGVKPEDNFAGEIHFPLSMASNRPSRVSSSVSSQNIIPPNFFLRTYFNLARIDLSSSKVPYNFYEGEYCQGALDFLSQ